MLRPKPVVLGLAAATLSLSACSSDMNMNMNMGSGDMRPPSSEPVPAITFDALYVVNGGDSTLTVVDTETNEIASTIKLNDAMFPHHIYLNAGRSKLALAVPGMDLSAGHNGGMPGMMGAVLEMDSQTGATLKARMLDAMNHNAIFSPDGSEIWTSQMATPGTVLVLDATTLDTKQTVAVGDEPAEITFSADGKQAFVANGGSDSVSVIDAVTKASVKTIPVGQDPVGPWQAANGIAYVDNEKSMTLSAIDTLTLEVKTTYNLGFMPGMAALAPDGSLWVTNADDGALVVYMADQDMRITEISTGAGAHGIAFSGDGTTGYVSNQMANTVSVIDVTARAVNKTLSVGAKPNGMTWRPK